MRARWWKRTGLGLAVLVLFAAAVVQLNTGSRIGNPVTHPVNKAIVSLGDSTLSGEGAGSYVDGTNGKDGNFCHRSSRAEVLRTAVPHYPFKYNFACSGAKAADIGKTGKYGEPAQAGQLRKVAKQHRIGAVVLSVGANDDPGFSALLGKCVQASLFGSPCSQGFRHEWRSQVDAMVPKVTKALRTVRDTMRQAGYRKHQYELIVQSYAAPVGPNAKSELRSLDGCPFTGTDLRWIRGAGIRTLDDGMRRAAESADARYLDMAAAGRGHEACTGNAKGHQEWFNRLRIDWKDLKAADRARHAIAASFHPNAAGHAAFAKCLSAFVAGDKDQASCRGGAAGHLRPVQAAGHG